MSGKVIGLSACSGDAIAAHYFSSPHIHQLSLSATQDISHLSGAAAIVFTGSLFEADIWLKAARAINLPRYFLINENVMTMREEPHIHTHRFHQHGVAELRAACKDFAGVLVANAPLQAYVRAQQLHDNVQIVPPTAPWLAHGSAAEKLSILGFAKPRPIRIAFFGAPVRQGFFAQIVLPALHKLSHNHNVELIAFGCAPGSLDLPSSRLFIRTPAWEDNFVSACSNLAAWNPEIIVQPEPENLSSTFKVPHMLMLAARIGAAVVASRVPPYRDLALQPDAPLMLADNTTASWEESLRLILSADALRAKVARNAIEFSKREWPESANRAAIAKLAAQHADPDIALIGKRAAALAEVLEAPCAHVAQTVALYRNELQQQALALAQQARDAAELAASLQHSERILATYSATQAAAIVGRAK